MSAAQRNSVRYKTNVSTQVGKWQSAARPQLQIKVQEQLNIEVATQSLREFAGWEGGKAQRAPAPDQDSKPLNSKPTIQLDEPHQ
jgi:hypothetical protein